jgi:hypothetical protein
MLWLVITWNSVVHQLYFLKEVLAVCAFFVLQFADYHIDYILNTRIQYYIPFYCKRNKTQTPQFLLGCIVNWKDNWRLSIYYCILIGVRADAFLGGGGGAVESLPEFLWIIVMKLPEFNLFSNKFARIFLIFASICPRRKCSKWQQTTKAEVGRL